MRYTCVVRLCVPTVKKKINGSFHWKRKIRVRLSKLAIYSSFRKIDYIFQMCIKSEYKRCAILVLAAAYGLKERLNVFNVAQKNLLYPGTKFRASYSLVSFETRVKCPPRSRALYRIVRRVKGKSIPYSITSIEAESDPGSLGSQPTGDVVINPVVGCHYFPPGPRLHFQPESVTGP